MDGTLPKISFLKLQGRVAPITPWGWMGVDGMDLKLHQMQITAVGGYISIRVAPVRSRSRQ